MEQQDTPGRLARFGQFELDVSTGDLRKAGRRVRLGGQPLRILELLLAAGGDLVTREQVRAALWADDTFVDFDHSLNAAIKRLRAALGDHADNPRFVETVPKRGYRLLVPVTWSGPVSGVGPASNASGRDGVARSDGPDASGRSGQTTVPDARHGRLGTSSRRIGWVVGATAVGVTLVVLALSRGAGHTSTPAPPSIAVLPFATAGPSAAGSPDDYLAFGLADALITELARVELLRVVSHTSSARYQSSGKALPVIAGELGVDVVVEGAVIRDGERVRATVQVVDAATDAHIWAHSFEQTGGPLLTFATDVARTVASQVQRLLLPAGSTVTAPPPALPDVAEAFLRGRYHLSKATEAEYARARRYFEEALALDPDHAASHSGLADFYVLNDSLPPREAFPLARVHAERAIELDPRLADAHVSLAYARFYGDWDWSGAEASFRQALALDADHVRAHGWLARLLSTVGRPGEADTLIRRALALDPVDMVSHDADATIHFNARRFDEAAGVGRTMIEMDRFDARGYEHLALASLQLGDAGEALRAMDTVLDFAPSPMLEAFRAMSLGRLGRMDDAVSTLDGLMPAGGEPQLPEVIHAIARAAIGQHDLALDALDRAFSQRDPYLVLLRVTPWFDALRENPRYQQLVQRLAFPPTAG